MNRKKKAKRAVQTSVHPLNDFGQWPDSVISCAPPLSKEWQAAFQKRIDDTFGTDGIVLGWSGDKTFWDEFYTDWFINGQPKKESLQKKPILLWKCFPLSKWDYIEIIPPRWILMEKHYAAQYASSWEASSWVGDNKTLGGKKRVRPERPPPHLFVHWQTIAKHEQNIVLGANPPCCIRQLKAGAICYGEYRIPGEEDLQEVANLRDFNIKNKAQRADEPLTAHSLQQVNRATEFYYVQAARQERRAMNDFMMAHPEVFLGAAMKDRGIKLSAREQLEIIKEACDRDDEHDKEIIL